MTRRLFPVLLILLTLTAAAQQPQQPSDKGMDPSEIVRKNLAPVSKDLLKVNLPRPTETTLSNGLTVMIIEDHRLPLVSIQYNISAAGPLFEPADMQGLAGIAAGMLKEGTRTRNSVRIADDIARTGATVSASSSFGSSATVVTASGLSDNFEEWFGIANDMLLNPQFPADELNRLKDRMKVQLRQQRTSAGFLQAERFNMAVYGTHPGATISATAASIDRMTPQVLAKWHDDRYAPQNAILGIIGDVHSADLLPKLEKWLSGWKKSDLKETLPPNAKPLTAKKVYLVDRPGSVQTSLMMGNIAIDRRDPDYFAFVVANYILGGGSASRVYTNLREQKGFTYGAYSSFSALKYPGPWRAYADVRTEVTDGAMTEFVKEIGRMRNEPVSATELDDAKRAIVASFALELESPDTMLNYAVVRKVYGFPVDYWDTYPVKLSAITVQDVQRVAKKYLDPDTMQIVAVGDASKIKTVMAKYGPVQLYNADGSKVGN